MRLSLPGRISGDASSNTILLASAVLFVSGAMQLASTWMQWQLNRDACAGAPAPADTQDTYTWRGDDYPTELPLDLRAPVAMTFEDSRHYALDTPDARAEYRSLYPGNDLGFVRLGPERRFFGLVMYHQLHCLDSLRAAIVAQDSAPVGHHTRHCLNYLREQILCAADTTLEPEVVLGSQDVKEGLGVTRVCRDWGKVYDFVENNYYEWQSWKAANATAP